MNINANLCRVWLSVLAFANPSCNHQQGVVTRMLLPGQQLIQIPAPPGMSNRSASGELAPVRFLLDTAMYPGEGEKMEIAKYCGLAKYDDHVLERTLVSAGFEVQWGLRFGDTWPQHWMRFRRGALYGDLVTYGDTARECRAFIIRVQVVADPDHPTPWSGPFLLSCSEFTPSPRFPFPADVYPVRDPDPSHSACKRSEVERFYKFLPNLGLGHFTGPN
jgi:hypothetical protein